MAMFREDFNFLRFFLGEKINSERKTLIAVQLSRFGILLEKMTGTYLYTIKKNISTQTLNLGF